MGLAFKYLDCWQLLLAEYVKSLMDLEQNLYEHLYLIRQEKEEMSNIKKKNEERHREGKKARF